MEWDTRALRATFALLTASLVLLLAGLAGVGASLAVLGIIVAVAVVLFVFRDRLDVDAAVASQDVGDYGTLLWTGPTIAAAVCLVFLGASPAELQALGGLVGLVGMANYFLRPVYRAVSAFARRLTRTSGRS
jgi:hypothetical protein